MKTWDIKPGQKWRIARRITQAFALVAVVVGPILGGWQRGYRGTLSAWRMRDWDLPRWLIPMLPDVPSQTVYEANQFVGGGAAVDYFDLPVADPVASTVALLWGQTHFWAVIAWAVPIVLALLFGRIFCGWFCPFGTLARGLDRLLSVLPWKHRGFEIPKQRPVRWVLLFLAIVGGALGGQWVAFIFLPHALLQASAYALLLLGGAGAVGGAFLGLMLAGVIFGPTVYCASLCPTGAALGLFGRARIAHVKVTDPATCGSCTLCHRACWLGLEPAVGDPGPDCDLCTRCFTACPKSKMVVEIGRPRRSKTTAAVASVVLMLVAGSVYASDWDTQESVPHKPEMLLAGYRETPEFTAAITVLNLAGAQFTQDTEKDTGIEISAYVVKGSKAGFGLDGNRAEEGDVYAGRLTVVITPKKQPPITVSFEQPTSPISTPKRAIYRRRVDVVLRPGDRVALQPIPGFFSEPMEFVIPEVRPARDGAFGWYLLAATLTFGGLLSLALGLGSKESAA